MLRNEHRIEGKPCADPFIIAAAKMLDGCVVTEESIETKCSKYTRNVCDTF